MKKPLIFTLPLLCFRLTAQQPPFDFKSLDKFDAMTEHKTKITLDGDMLKLASKFLGSDDDKDKDKDADSVRNLVNNLKGIYIRNYEFDKDGQYTQADIEPLRAYLKQQQWTRIVEQQDGKELSEVYVQPLSNEKFGGVAIIAAEARELTVVYINGALKLSDLAQLGGNMGIPEVDLSDLKELNNLKKTSPKKEKKDD
jgi:hypothetical protein